MTKNSSTQEVALVPSISAEYDLGRIIDITPTSEGYANHNYIVTTAHGIYVMKFLHNQDRSGALNDVVIQQQLIAHQICTPVYIKAQGGQHIVAVGAHLVVCSEYIDGIHQNEVSVSLARELGEVLAKFHTHVKRITHQRTGWLNPHSIKDTMKVPDFYTKNLPSGIIHGDLHRENILVDQDMNHIVAILDFEEAEENVLIVDIARTILGVCYSQSNNALKQDLIDSLLEGYQTVRPLARDEIRYLPEAITYVANMCIRWFNAKGYEDYAKVFAARADTLQSIRIG